MKKLLAVIAFGLASCAGNSVTAFTPGLEPLEENTAAFPTGTASDPYPEKVNDTAGHTEAFDWVHTRGYIKAPVEKVWASLRNPDVVVDRREVTSWTSEKGIDPAALDSNVIHNTVVSVVVVQFDISWRHGLAKGTEKAPEVTAARWQKTAGSDYIELDEGSVVLNKVDANTTSIEVVGHLKAFTRDYNTTKHYIRDMYNAVVAQSKDLPLPIVK